MKEKKARVEDAMHATRAAVEEGIVPGGGVALVRARRARSTSLKVPDEEQIGVQIVRRAVAGAAAAASPMNAGVDGSVVLDKMQERQGRVRLQRRAPSSSRI